MGFSLITTALILALAGPNHIEYVDHDATQATDPRVEAIFDKGIVQEMIVKCSDELSGMIIYTPSEKTYTDAQHRSYDSLKAAIDGTCEG